MSKSREGPFDQRPASLNLGLGKKHQVTLRNVPGPAPHVRLAYLPLRDLSNSRATSAWLRPGVNARISSVIGSSARASASNWSWANPERNVVTFTRSCTGYPSLAWARYTTGHPSGFPLVSQ